MTFVHYFLLLDSFGVGINFHLKGNKLYRSHLGGFVTILIYVATIVCGIYFSQELFEKISPTLSTTFTNFPHPPKIAYPENFFFIFGVTVNSTPLVDEKIFRPVGYINTKINGSEELVRQNISVEKCSEVLNQEYKYYDIIKHLNLSNFYCVSLNETKNKIKNSELYVNEFWGNEGFRMLQVKIFNCNAVAENISECASDDIIKEKLKSPIITYYTLKNYIDTTNYKNPYVRGLQETFYYVSYRKFISATQYLKHVEVHTDKGYLFSEEEINPDHTVDSMIEYSETEQEDGKIFTMSIQLTNKIEIYSRSYYKLQDIGAEIGAVYGALNVVFGVLFHLYNNSKLFCNIINKFFLIKEDFEPMKRENRAFLNLKKKFFHDLNLTISVRKTSFITSHRSFNNFNNLIKNKKDLNLSSISDLNSPNKNKITEDYLKTSGELKNIDFKEKRKKENIFLKSVLNKKKDEDKKKLNINFTYVDRFLCLYLIDLCRNKVNRYSYYNFFYRGKDYIIDTLDITNYLKYNTFLKMLFLINSKETRELYDYVTTPILASEYVGPRFKVD